MREIFNQLKSGLGAQSRRYVLKLAPPARLVLAGYSVTEISVPAGGRRSRPTVSVVVPCYNYGRFLRSCVQSVLEQDGVSVDVVIVDDASTDDTPAVAAELAAADSRVRVVRHATNAGHIATYNDGLERVHGEYVMLLSADDLLTPGALLRATALLEARPSVGLVYGCLVLLRDDVTAPARTTVRRWVVWPGRAWLGDVCRTGMNPVSSQAVLRTSVQRQIGGYRTDLPHTGDLEMWMRAAKVADVGLLLGVDQGYYRQHQSSMSRTTYFGWLRDLEERALAFDIALTGPADADLLRKARRTLAREALAHARSAYERGVAADEPIAEYLEFAKRMWPEADGLRAWRAVARQQTAYASGGRPRRSVHLRRALSETWIHLRYLRLRWAGVY